MTKRLFGKQPRPGSLHAIANLQAASARSPTRAPQPVVTAPTAAVASIAPEVVAPAFGTHAPQYATGEKVHASVHRAFAVDFLRKYGLQSVPAPKPVICNGMVNNRRVY